jgi:hypothetical protein
VPRRTSRIESATSGFRPDPGCQRL